MTRRSFRILVSAVVLAVLVQPAWAQTAPTVDEVIAGNLAAKGGLERLKEVDAIRQTAEFSIQGLSGTMTILTMRPNLMRQELQMGAQTVISGFDGETPWMVNPASGSSQAIVMQGPQADMVRRQASFDGPLVNYKERGITAALLASETVNGAPAYHVQLTYADGPVQHLYIDQASMLEVRIVTDAPEGSVEQRLSDFRDVEGFKMPFSIEVLMGGQPSGTLKVTRVELNPSLEVALFRIPR